MSPGLERQAVCPNLGAAAMCLDVVALFLFGLLTRLIGEGATAVRLDVLSLFLIQPLFLRHGAASFRVRTADVHKTGDGTDIFPLGPH